MTCRGRRGAENATNNTDSIEAQVDAPSPTATVILSDTIYARIKAERSTRLAKIGQSLTALRAA
jgi:hypothetical protein